MVIKKTKLFIFIFEEFKGEEREKKLYMHDFIALSVPQTLEQKIFVSLSCHC